MSYENDLLSLEKIKQEQVRRFSEYLSSLSSIIKEVENIKLSMDEKSQLLSRELGYQRSETESCKTLTKSAQKNLEEAKDRNYQANSSLKEANMKLSESEKVERELNLRNESITKLERSVAKREEEVNKIEERLSMEERRLKLFEHDVLLVAQDEKTAKKLKDLGWDEKGFRIK